MVRRLIVDHVIDPVRRGWRIKQPPNRLRHISMVSDGHALTRWKPSHHRRRFLDVRIAIPIHERQPKHPNVEVFECEKVALGSELAHGIGHGGRARRVFADEPSTSGAVDQSGAREDKPLHRSGLGGACERSRADIVRSVRLLRRCASERRRRSGRWPQPASPLRRVSRA